MPPKKEIYWLADTVWYAPFRVIQHYWADLKPLPEDQKTSKPFRKAGEMLSVAIAMLGMQMHDSKEYWVQAVPESERSPDVRTGTPAPLVEGQPPLFETQDVEVVDFVPQQGEDIAAFLARTKLSPEKAYDAKTTVLCHVQTNTHIPSVPAITAALRGAGAVCPVIVLGRTHSERTNYTLFQVHPQFKQIVDFSVVEALKSQPNRGVLNLKRGSKPGSESRPEEKHCPFETLGFKCVLI